MSAPSFTVTFDATCALDQPRTGVGYAGVYLVRALAEQPAPPAIRIFATRSGGAALNVPEWIPYRFPTRVMPRMGHVKTLGWTRFNAPTIETLTGSCDIAHGLFHLTPAARHARRVVTIHDLSFIRHPEMHTDETVRVHGKLVRHAASKADAIITVSENARDEVRELLNVRDDRVFAVPNGIDTVEFELPSNPERRAVLCSTLGIRGPYAIHIGTLEPRKNIERLIRSFMQIRDKLDEMQLLLVGRAGWKSTPIVDAIRDAGDAVIHAGHIDRADAVSLLQGARACLYPSLYEGFGLPVLEAMAAGTPVLTSNVSALPEVAGDAALLADPEDEEALAQGIVALVEDEALRERLSTAGRLRAGSMTWARSAERLQTTYEHILG